MESKLLIAMILLGMMFFAGCSIEKKTTTRGALFLRGNENSPVSIIVFSDYLCPYCAKQELENQITLSNYINDGKVTLYHKDFIVHPDSVILANAVRCSSDFGLQNDMSKLIFENQNSGDVISGLSQIAMNTKIIGYANMLDIPLQDFTGCLSARKYMDIIEKNNEEAKELGLTGTPVTFVNGEMVEGYIEPLKMVEIVKRHLADK